MNDTTTIKSKVNRIEDEHGRRWYEHEGEKYASVTTVLDVVQHLKLNNYFKNNSKNAIEKKRVDTADFGSKLHRMVELNLKNVHVDIADPALKKCFEHWLTLRDDKGISATHSETVVVSRKYGFAGSLDILGTFNGKTCVMDIKTGWYGVKAGYQMAAYRQAAIEEGLTDTSCGLAGINIHRNGDKVNCFEYEHIDFCFRRFLYALECFKGLYFNELNKMNWSYLKIDAVETYFKGA